MRSHVTSKNVSWPRLIWPTLYSTIKHGPRIITIVVDIFCKRSIWICKSAYSQPIPDWPQPENRSIIGMRQEGHPAYGNKFSLKKPWGAWLG